MPKRIGRYTIFLENKPSIIGNAAVVGKKEGEGPLAEEFDKIHEDEFLGKETFEKAESELVKDAVTRALFKADEKPEDIDCCFSGDLLNQCIGSSFGLREFNIPFSGLSVPPTFWHFPHALLQSVPVPPAQPPFALLCTAGTA